MNDQLKSLLEAIPELPAREDSALLQVQDLVLVAKKLGMPAAAEYLTRQLAEHNRWYGPKPLHPEQEPGEVHLCNLAQGAVRSIGWKSKRAGEVAYDWNGQTIEGQVPVFVQAQELRAAGQLTERDTIA